VIKLHPVAYCFVIGLAFCLAAPSSPLLPAAAAAGWQIQHAAADDSDAESSVSESDVLRQAKTWAARLSTQKPFDSWKHASPDIQTLGPGTHGWLATLKAADGRIVGYMVMHAVADGTLQLSEYGVGPHPLYDPAMLDQTLRENGLIDSAQAPPYRAVKYYAHPFAAVWQVAIGNEVYWVDAKTSEILPLHAESWEQLQQQFSLAAAKTASEPALFEGSIASCRIGESFDAYDRLPWLTGESPISVQDEEKVQHRLNSSLHLRYVVEPYGDAVLYAVPVIGYLSIGDDRLDLAVDMAGARFIPIETLSQYGRFYA